MFTFAVADIGCCASMGHRHSRRHIWYAAIAYRSNCYAASLWTSSSWSASCFGNGT